MAGVLQFVLGMNGSQFDNAVRQSTAETQKLLKASQMVSKAAVEIYDTMAKAKKGMVLDTPGMEKHAGSVRHLRHELSLVGEAVSVAGAELGGLGRLAGLAFNPWLIAISAVVMALNNWKDVWEQRMEQMAAVSERMAGLTTARMEASISAASTALEQNTRFAVSLEHSADAQDRESQAMERRIALFAAMTNGQREVFAAQRDATEATIAAAEAAHSISPLQAIQQRNAAENTERAAAQRAELAQMDQEISQKQARLDEAESRLQAAVQSHGAAVATATHPREVLNAEKARVEDLRRNLEDQTKGAANSQAFASAVKGVAHSIGGNWGRAVQWAGSQRFDVAKIDRGQLAQARDLLKIGEERLAQLEAQQQPLDANIEKADKQAAIEQEIKNTYAAQIEQLKQLLDIKKKTQDEENLAKAQEQDARENEQKIKAWGEMRDRLNGRTSFEKMGFHFGGRGPFSANQVAGSLTLSHLHESSVTRHAADHNAQVAANTRQTNQLISQLIGLVGRTASSAVGNMLTNRMP
jgi:hypothetical protein